MSDRCCHDLLEAHNHNLRYELDLHLGRGIKSLRDAQFNLGTMYENGELDMYIERIDKRF